MDQDFIGSGPSTRPVTGFYDPPEEIDMTTPSTTLIPSDTQNFRPLIEQQFMEQTILANQDNPDMIARVESALHLSDMMNTTFTYSFDHVEDQARTLYQDRHKLAPGFAGVAQAARIAYHNMDKEIEIGRLMSELLVSDGDPDKVKEYLNRAADIELEKVDEPYYTSPWHTIAAAPASIAPFMAATLGPAIAGLAVGAGVGALATASAPATLTAAAALGSKAAMIGRSIGSFTASARIMGGMQLYQMLQAEDENGETIPFETARRLSIGAGVINGMIEAAQLDLLMGSSFIKEVYRASAARTLARTAAAGTAYKVGVGFLKQYGANVASEVVTEVAQEYVDALTYNIAVDMANSKQGSNLDLTEFEEFAKNVQIVARDTAIGTGILGIPGTFGQVKRARAAYRSGSDMAKRVMEATDGKASSELVDAVLSGDAERADAEINKYRQDNPLSVDDIVLERTDKGYTTRIGGADVASFDFEVSGDTVRFTNVTVNDIVGGDARNSATAVAAAKRAIYKIHEDNPGVKVEFDPENENHGIVKRAIEDSLTLPRKYNKLIDQAKFRIAADKESIANLRQSIDQLDVVEEGIEPLSAEERAERVAGIESEIEAIESDIARDENAINEFTGKKEVESAPLFENTENKWSVTTDVYAQRVRAYQEIHAKEWKSDPDKEYVADQIRKLYDGGLFSESEIGLTITQIEHAANRAGKSFSDYVKSKFAPVMFAGNDVIDSDLRVAKARAGVRNMGLGKNVVMFARDGDFTSMMHELAHMFVYDLTQGELQVVARWLDEKSLDPSQWSRASHEKFVNGYFKWVHKKEKFTGVLADVFRYFKTFLGKAYEVLKGEGELTDEMEAVYSRLFGEDTTSEAVVEADSFNEAVDKVKTEVEDNTLYQSRDTDSHEFKAWFGDSKVVDENGDPLVAYHSTRNNFDSFKISDDYIGAHFGVNPSQADDRLFAKQRVAEKVDFRTDAARRIDSMVAELRARLNDISIESFTGDAKAQKESSNITREINELLSGRDDSPLPGKETEASGSVYPVYLSIKNPYPITDLVVWTPGLIAANSPFSGNTFEEIRESMKSHGYDGFVYDNRGEGYVDQEGIDNTAYIAIDPTQIKSVNNRGTWSTEDDRILYQPRDMEHMEETKAAVERFELVPTVVLQEYLDQDWAVDEVARRIIEMDRPVELQWMYDVAEESANYKEFVERIGEMATLDNRLSSDTEILSDVWHDAKVVNLAQGNQEWVNGLNDSQLLEIAQMAQDGIWNNSELLTNILKDTKIISSPQIRKKLKDHYRNNGAEIRRLLATEMSMRNIGDYDYAALRKLWREQNKTAMAGNQEEATALRKINSAELAERLLVARNDPYWVQIRRGNTNMKLLDRMIKESAVRITEANAEKITSLKKINTALSGLRKTATGNGVTDINYMMKQVTDMIKALENPNIKDADIKVINQHIANSVKHIANTIKGGEKVSKEYKKYMKANLRAQAARQRTQEARKIKKHMNEMILRMRRAANSQGISVGMQNKIKELLSLIDENVVIDYKMAREESIRRMYEASSKEEVSTRNLSIEEMKNISPFDFLPKKDRVSVDDVSEYTFEDVERLYNHAMTMKALGRQELMIIKEMDDRLSRENIDNLIGSLAYEYPEGEPDIATGRFSRKIDWSAINRSSLTPPRLADMLDGGQGFMGAHHDFFINQATQNNNDKLRKLRERRKSVIGQLNGLDLGVKFTEKNFVFEMRKLLLQTDERWQAFGQQFNLDEALEIYAAMKNDSKRTALILGNGRDRILAALRNATTDEERAGIFERVTSDIEAEFMAIAASLTDEQVKIVEIIVDEYANNYDRLESAIARYENKNLGYEAFYTPMIVTGRSFELHEKQIAEEIMIRSGMKRAGLDKGFSIERLKNIRLEHRRALKLGLFSNWESAIVRQEHYMAHRAWAKRANDLINNNAGGEWRRMIESDKNGPALLNLIRHYVNAGVISPQAMKLNGEASRLMKTLRQNVAQAYLAFNMMTVLKQAPSLGFYLVETSASDILGAIKTMSDNHAEFMERAIERNPALMNDDMGFSEISAMMDNPSVSMFKQKSTKFGMALIQFVDQHAKAIGEEAVYQNALRRGMTPFEANQLAQNVTNRTQPVGGAMNTSKLFTESTFFLFTQFSKQLNQIWNMMTYDAVSAYGKKEFQRQRLGTLVGLMLSSYMIWAITNRQMLPDPEEPEDFVNLIFSQGISAIPIAGPIIYAQMQGYQPEVAATSPIAAMGSITGIGLDMLTGDANSYEMRKAGKALLEGAAIAGGVPFVAPERIWDATKSAMEGDANMLEMLSIAITGGVPTIIGEKE